MIHFIRSCVYSNLKLFDLQQFSIFTTRKRSLGQGNKFTGICLSRGGVPDQIPPWADTPPGRPPMGRPPGQRHTHPPGQTPPPSLGRPPQADTPLGKPLPGQRHPPWADPSRAETPPGQTHPLGLSTPPPPIRSTRGRIASYWNANLLEVSMCNSLVSVENNNFCTSRQGTRILTRT